MYRNIGMLIISLNIGDVLKYFIPDLYIFLPRVAAVLIIRSIGVRTFQISVKPSVVFIIMLTVILITVLYILFTIVC